MKLSELLTIKEKAYEYLLGALYSFKYKNNQDYMIIFASKTQSSTGHFPEIKDFYDQLKRASDFYNFDFLSIFTPLNDMNDCVNSKVKNFVGYGLIIENDIQDSNLDLEIIKKINVEKDKLDFLRGLFDSRSSIDTTARYLSMDMKKNDSKWFAGNIYKMLHSLSKNIRVNINPRFLQPGAKSRDKNPQLRINVFDYFGLIGTFRINYLNKANKAGWWKNLENGTNIPIKFESLIIWDTSTLQALLVDSKTPKINELVNDQEYSTFITQDDKDILYEYFSVQNEKNNGVVFGVKNISKKRNKLSNEVVMKVLEKSNKSDFFDSSLNIEKNKRGEPLLDIHHIIPHRYSYIFDEKYVIDQPENLVAITQNNHYLLHRGEFSDKKNDMLHKLFYHAENFLKNNNVNISFEEFKSLY